MAGIIEQILHNHKTTSNIILEALRMMKMKTMMVMMMMMMMKGVLAQKRVCQKGAQGLDYKGGSDPQPRYSFSISLQIR